MSNRCRAGRQVQPRANMAVAGCFRRPLSSAYVRGHAVCLAFYVARAA